MTTCKDRSREGLAAASSPRAEGGAGPSHDRVQPSRLAQALALPQGFWAVITALIVTQSNVGGSLKAALDRFIGSVFGAVYGSAVAFAIPHEHGFLRAATLVVAVAPLSFLATLSAGFRIAPITAI